MVYPSYLVALSLSDFPIEVSYTPETNSHSDNFSASPIPRIVRKEPILKKCVIFIFNISLIILSH